MVRNEIEARYAPESNDRFIRVTRGDGSVEYISGEPNDESFSPTEVPWPGIVYSGINTRVERMGSTELLVATVPFVTGTDEI